MLSMLGISWEQLERRLFVKKNHAEGSRARYKSKFGVIYHYFLNRPFTEESIYDFVSYLQNERKIANGTINNYATLLKHICKELKIELMSDWESRKESLPVIDVWSKKELETLVKAAYTLSFRKGVVVETLTKTAMRNQEIASIRISDFKETYFILQKTKSQEKQTIPIVPSLAIKIRQLIKEVKNYNHDYIFGCDKGKLYYETLNKYIREAAALTGIKKDIRSHIIRHSVCTIANKSNVSIFKVQKFMRHKDPNTTLRYSHVDMDDVRQVAEIVSTGDMTYETYIEKLKEFHAQYPNVPFKVTLLEEQGKVLLEVCDNVIENKIDSNK